MVISGENEKMDFQPIRRARLAKLIKENFDGSQSKFVDATGENQGEISGLLHSKSFGEKKARKIERLCNMPIGWLDREDDQTIPQGLIPVSVADGDDPNFIEIRKIKLRLSAGISGFAVDLTGGIRWRPHRIASDVDDAGRRSAPGRYTGVCRNLGRSSCQFNACQ